MNWKYSFWREILVASRKGLVMVAWMLVDQRICILQRVLQKALNSISNQNHYDSIIYQSFNAEFDLYMF